MQEPSNTRKLIKQQPAINHLLTKGVVCELFIVMYLFTWLTRLTRQRLRYESLSLARLLQLVKSSEKAARLLSSGRDPILHLHSAARREVWLLPARVIA